MPPMRRTRSLLLVPALLLLAACETTNIVPAGDATATLEDDERRMWKRAAEEEAILERSGFVANVPELESYLDGIVAGLKPEPLAEGASFRVRVLVDPALNAFAMPNGAVYIHTGILARLENEAQLATVLAHEITHATHRHGLKSFRNFKNKTAFAAAFNAGTAGVGGLLGAIGAASAISGYSQDLEREADVTGFRMIAAAGYDPRECSKVFKVLLAESKRSKIKQPFFFGSHPRLEERNASFEQLVAAVPADRRNDRVDAEEFAERQLDILLLNAIAAQQAGDADFARDCAQRFRQHRPDNPHALLVLADVERKRGDDDEALRLYRETTDAHSEFADGFRGLGLALFKRGDHADAAAAFRRYLELAPAAADRGHVESLLQQCEPRL